MRDAAKPHRKRMAIPGHARYLTFSCFHNQRFLSRDRTRRWLLERLDELHQEGSFDLWAYVIMPEHCHLLIRPNDPGLVSSLLCRLKKSVANRAVAWVRQNHPLSLSAMLDVQPNGRKCFRFWQRNGGYDRNLFSPAEVREKIDCIHANPVRRGLVCRPQDWPWSSYLAWSTGQDLPIGIDRHTVPLLR